MIISMAWTTAPFLALRKSCTRREWSWKTARKFQPGTWHDAWDKSPRYGGRKIGTIVVVSCKLENTGDMPDSDYEAEGFRFMEEQGLEIWGMHPREAFEKWREDAVDLYTLRFNILSIIKGSGAICSV